MSRAMPELHSCLPCYKTQAFSHNPVAKIRLILLAAVSCLAAVFFAASAKADTIVSGWTNVTSDHNEGSNNGASTTFIENRSEGYTSFGATTMMGITDGSTPITNSAFLVVSSETFSAKAGDKLVINYRATVNGYSNENGGWSSAQLNCDLLYNGLSENIIASYSSDWTTSEITIPETNAYTIQILVAAQAGGPVMTAGVSIPQGSAILDVASVYVTAAPEPSMFALLGVGAVSLATYAWRVKRRRK